MSLSSLLSRSPQCPEDPATAINDVALAENSANVQEPDCMDWTEGFKCETAQWMKKYNWTLRAIMRGMKKLEDMINTGASPYATALVSYDPGNHSVIKQAVGGQPASQSLNNASIALDTDGAQLQFTDAGGNDTNLNLPAIWVNQQVLFDQVEVNATDPISSAIYTVSNPKITVHDITPVDPIPPGVEWGIFEIFQLSIIEVNDFAAASGAWVFAGSAVTSSPISSIDGRCAVSFIVPTAAPGNALSSSVVARNDNTTTVLVHINDFANFQTSMQTDFQTGTDCRVRVRVKHRGWIRTAT